MCLCSCGTGVREQPVGERRARRADRARRQLRRQQHGAGTADTHAEHAGMTTHCTCCGLHVTYR